MTLPRPYSAFWIRHRNLLQAAGLLSVALFCASGSHADNIANCTYDVRSLEYAQCATSALAGDLVELRKRLDQSYRQALEKVPDRAIADADGRIRRTTPELKQHLIQAQGAWQTYVNESCAYEGGVWGGSSLTITIATTRCLIRETKSRLEYFEHMSTGR
jgi:uncharacterized protein YecT (DUF1311 family)